MRLLLLAVLGVCVAGHVIQVTSLGDELDAACPDPAKCTYRKALDTAMAYPDSESVLINLPAGRILLSGDAIAELNPGKDIAIAGHPSGDTILDGGGRLQMLHAHVNVNVNVTAVTFFNGSATAAFGTTNQGGAILNNGKMFLSGCHFLSNFAAEGGGAIMNDGQLSMEECSFVDGRSGTSAGALNSQASDATVDARRCHFERNRAEQAGGAIDNAGATMSLDDCTFVDHTAGTTGGTIRSTGGLLHVTNTTMRRSTAGNGGIVANECDNDICSSFVAEGVLFAEGLATQFQGGAILSGAPMHLTSCAFEANLARNAQENPQGASISIDQPNASATLLNVTFNGSYAALQMVDHDTLPSEVYIGPSAPGSRFNCTFCAFVGCHANMLLFAPQNAGAQLEKAALRGGSFCEDGSREYDGALASISSDTLAMLRGCDDDEPPACGPGAQCTQQLDNTPTAEGFLGVRCDCPSVAGHGKKWGFAYGADEAIPHSEGFAGCFEQWRPELSVLTADVCGLTPPFDPATLNSTCCALRPTTSATVNATADAFDHAHLAPSSASTVTVALSEAAPSATVTLSTVSFDESATADYTLRLTWVPGDIRCTPGESLPCYNSSGVVQPCTTATLYPVHELPGTMACADAPPDVPGCGYAQYNFSHCACPECKANFIYACACGDGVPDGSIACDADGKLTTCNCDAPYAYPPFAPPPSAPPATPSSSIGVVLGIVGAVVAVGGAAGGTFFYRRYRERRLQQAYSNLLLNPAADVDVPIEVEGGAAYQQYSVQNDS